ncbi:MAG: efflux transporter outer membrane subunit [Alphaproteobacteria bacterium]|nr:efflux transporter outer membrane subunit [Alphaproteobacteria bacterium]
MRKPLGSLVVGVLLLSGCDLAPEYSLPEIAMPSFFKEDIAEAVADVAPASDGSWKRFDETANIEEFAWWRMFQDDTLNRLMDEAMQDNPSLTAAIERVNAARAVAERAGAPLLPSVEVGFGPQRQLSSAAAVNANLPPDVQASTRPTTLYTARGTISYELDLFGKNHGAARAATEDAAAEESNYRTARLALQAELAQTYFRVRALREEEALVQQLRDRRAQTRQLTEQKHAAGAVDALVVSAAQTDLAQMQAEHARVVQARAVAEHALAVLVGKPPAQLTLEMEALHAAPPVVPAGLPSSLLERRPDIRQAEQQIAAANARIGVARAGYFPDISLSATGGSVAGSLSDLFQWSSRTWSIGPLAGTILTQPLFEGGRLAAARAQTEAEYQEAVAAYRASVLTAFREVEDQLSGIHSARAQTEAAQEALDAATLAHQVARDRLAAGYSSQLDYLEAERQLLTATRGQVQALGQHYVDTVQLVKALGGSWQAPTPPEKTGALPTVP